jgi:hypothetical protein
MRESEVVGGPRAEHLITEGELPQGQGEPEEHGPGYPLFRLFASYTEKTISHAETPPPQYNRGMIRRATTRTTAIVGHLALIIGLVLIGYRHFDNIQTGVAVATLYLLLPYTAQMTPRVDHVIPAALLVWAVEAYRRPAVAGIFLGLASGLIFAPIFLVPLWCSFYWRRGLIRFLLGAGAALLLLTLSLILTSNSMASFLDQLALMFGGRCLSTDIVAGFWQSREPLYRIPVFAAFVVLCGSLALWPPQKNYGTLLSCSAAIMLASQFWYTPYGGIYLNWYLPLLLLTIFRPNLEDRVAVTAVTESWRWRRTTNGQPAPT